MTNSWGSILSQFSQILDAQIVDSQTFNSSELQLFLKQIQNNPEQTQQFIQDTFSFWENYSQSLKKNSGQTILPTLPTKQKILLKNISFALPISIALFNTSRQTINFIHQGLGRQINFAQDYRDEISLETLTENVHPDDLLEVNALIKQVNQAKLEVREQLPSIDCRFKTEKKEWAWLRIFSTVFRLDASEQSIELLLVIQDLRVKKNLELALSKSEERYQKFFSSIPLSVAIVDIENSFQILECNQGWEKLIKYPKKELINKNVLDLSPDLQGSGQKSSERLNQIISRYKKRYENITFDWQFQLKNKKSFDCEITLFPMQLDNRNIHTMLVRNISVQKKFERALVKSEEKYRNIFDNVYDGILILNQNRYLTSSNKAGYRILGIKPGETIFFPDLTHPEDRSKSDDYFLQLQQQGFFEGYQGKIITQNKEVKYVEISGVIIYDSEGDFAGSWEIIRDVTKQKENEIALQESEIRYQQLYENAFDGILILDPDSNKLVDCNQKLLEIFEEKNKEAALQKHPLDYSPEYQPDGSLSEVALVYHQNKMMELGKHEFEWQLLLNNKTEKFVKIFSILQSIGDNHLIVYIFEDISDKKKNEQERQRLFHLQQVIVDAIPAPFFLRGLNGDIITANKKAKEYWGVNQLEIEGLNQPISLTDYTLYFEKKDWEVMQNGFPLLNQIESFEHNNQTYWMRSNRIPFIDETGKIAGVLVYSNDITDLKEAQQTVELQNEDLMQTNEELDSLVYRAAHDLRSPISSVQGLLNIAKLEKDPEVIESYLDMADNNLSKLDGFIQDIVDYARNKRSEIDIQAIDFQNLVEEAIQQHIYIEDADKIKTNINIQNPVEFHSDFHRIQVIFNNLISNAFKYSDHRNKDAFLDISISFQNKKVNIVVKDNGIGISEEHVSHIFEMFYRASFKSKSSGIGLYITMESIKKLKGTIDVTSKLGEGTTFNLSFPDLRFV